MRARRPGWMTPSWWRTARIGGQKAVVAAMAFEFIGGSMGAAVGEGFVAAARLAVLQDAPLIVFTASGGARMQEGAISLMQMPRTIIAPRLVKEAGLPFIAVLTDPTTGGVTASFAMLGDIHIAEPGARRSASPARGSSSRPCAKSCRRVSSAPNTCTSTASSIWWCRARNWPPRSAGCCRCCARRNCAEAA